jgi:hypothetical protein
MNELNEKKSEWVQPSLDVIDIEKDTEGGDTEGGSDMGIWNS